MNDVALDAALASLAGVEPSRALQERVLVAVGVPEVLRERVLPASGPLCRTEASGHIRRGDPATTAPARGRLGKTGLLAVGAALALAAGVTLALRTAPVGDPAELVPRGAGAPPSALAVRVAVRRGTTVERFAAGTRYAAGDTLLFRVTLPSAGEVVLRRDGLELYRGKLPAGDADLPVGYALEPGEAAARFSVQAAGTETVVLVPEVAP